MKLRRKLLFYFLGIIGERELAAMLLIQEGLKQRAAPASRGYETPDDATRAHRENNGRCGTCGSMGHTTADHDF